MALSNINYWPLEKVIKLLEDDNQHSDPKMAATICKAQPIVDNLRIGEWAHDVKGELLKRFGEIPDPGPERGEYFMRVKNSFVDPKLGSLAVKIVAGRIQGLEAFVPFIKKGNLMKVKEAMVVLVKAIY